MSEFNDRPHQTDAEAAAELENLQRVRDELWTSLRGEEDPERRMALLSQLSDNRVSILRIVEQVGGEGANETPPPAPTPPQVDPLERIQNQIAEQSITDINGPDDVRAASFDPALAPPPTGIPSPDNRNGGPALAAQPVDGAAARNTDGYDANATSAFGVEGTSPAPQADGGSRPPGQVDGLAPPTPPAPPSSAPPNPPNGFGGTHNYPPNQQTPLGQFADGGGAPAHPGPPGTTRRAPGVYGAATTTVTGGDWAAPAAEPTLRRGRGALLAGLVLLAGALGVGAYLFRDSLPFGGSDTEAAGDVAGPDANAIDVQRINDLLASQDFAVTVELRDSALHLVGSVDSTDAFNRAVRAAETLADGTPIVTDELIVVGQETVTETSQTTLAGEEKSRARLFQEDLNRILASTPLVFGVGESQISELQKALLNNVVSVMRAYDGFQVKVIGLTDDVGDAAQNEALSRARAENVKEYLVSQGVPAEMLSIEARGESTSTGSSELAGLERRVEFEVSGAQGGNTASLRIAVVAPSAPDDRAFTQSMVDAVNAINEERGGGVEISVTHSTFVPEEAAAAVRRYAEAGNNLVIAHGSEFGEELTRLAAEFPDVAFAWGTGTDTFGAENIYSYDAAAEQGGYVMGALSTLLTESDVLGVVGPLPVGDAKRYVDGYVLGVQAQRPEIDVRVEYTNSFGDVSLAALVAEQHIDAGADVMTGSAEMVVGAINKAQERGGVLWFGTQANQSLLAPNLVVASQVYHWEVLLRQILADREAGRPGRSYLATLENGGLTIEFNPDFDVPESVRQLADQLIGDIANGTITVDVEG